MHLNADELIDIVEGRRSERDAGHLAACERCRRQLAELQTVMSAAMEVEVPEPSPLFWDHLSQRIHDAVAVEGAPGRGFGFGLFAGRSTWWRTLPLSIGAVAAMVIALEIGSRVPAPSAPASVGTAVQSVDEEARVTPLGSAGDPMLGLVVDLAAQVDWDAAIDATFTNHAGSVDETVSDLTDGERIELQRLLKQELGQS